MSNAERSSDLGIFSLVLLWSIQWFGKMWMKYFRTFGVKFLLKSYSFTDHEKWLHAQYMTGNLSKPFVRNIPQRNMTIKLFHLLSRHTHGDVVNAIYAPSVDYDGIRMNKIIYIDISFWIKYSIISLNKIMMLRGKKIS